MPNDDQKRSKRLASYLAEMTSGLGRVERLEALRNYARALMLQGERKSIQPLASRLAASPDETEAIRQRLQQSVAVAHWDEENIYRRIAEKFTSHVPDVEAVIVDDTGFPKKGRMSPCVNRQYSGTLGRRDNCQVAVSVHLASDSSGACIGMELFVPRVWCDDAKRRKKAHIPDSIEYRSKAQIALDMLEAREDWGLNDKVYLADAGYGDSHAFRSTLDAKGRMYVVGVSCNTAIWAGGRLPSPPERRKPSRNGIPCTGWSRDLKPESVQDVAEAAPESAWHHYEWVNGNNEPRTGEFLSLRIRHAYKASCGHPPGDEQWLLVQRDKEGKPSKFWLSNLDASEDPGRLVYLAKLRWRIERDYQEMKGELGLDHFEGRTWHGFHHHCALVSAAHAFLALERALFPPEGGNFDSTVSPSSSDSSLC